MAAETTLRSRLHGASLETKLILFSTSLTVLAVALTFAALSLEIRRQTKRLLADTLDQHQRMILDVQQRERDELLWISRLMTESPTLRAAMEIYQTERVGGAVGRPDLLATLQGELDRISGGLERDLLIVTDSRGRALAAKGDLDPGELAGLDLSKAPVIRQALDPDAPIVAGGFAVLSIGGRPFQLGCVPIVLQGYPIGGLILGDALDAELARRLGGLFKSDVVLVLGERVLGSTLPASEAAALRAPAAQAGAEGRLPTLPLAGEEYVASALPLGIDEEGHAATLYLLRSLTRALGPSNQGLLAALLVYGTSAVALAGLAAWLVSRSILGPLERFVAFLRSVTASGDRARRFEEPSAAPEVRTLSATYAQLMDSLRQHEQAMLERAREDLDRMDRLKESEKLAALGRMLSGAAHEINNPLTGVLGNIDILLGDAALASPVRERLERVRKEGRRIVSLVRNLLKTVHRDTGERSIVDLNQVARDCAALRQHDFSSAGVVLMQRLTSDKCRVLGNELELQQVFLNIINNALDALRESSRAPELIVRTSCAEDTICVEFLDNGPGMKEPQRVFDHFYTTKDVGKGTGLGLSITHAIVQHHGGRIAAENRPEGGARFAVTLPALAREEGVAEARTDARSDARFDRRSPSHLSDARAGSVDARPASEPSRPAAPDTLRAAVLVVDDEPTVLELQMAILESVGASVVGARTGSAALDELQAKSFDLVVSDLKIPGEISGQDLFHWAETNRPALARRFVFVTGDTVAEATQSFLERSGRRYIQKPFSIEDYVSILRETLHEEKAA